MVKTMSTESAPPCLKVRTAPIWGKLVWQAQRLLRNCLPGLALFFSTMIGLAATSAAAGSSELYLISNTPVHFSDLEFPADLRIIRDGSLELARHLVSPQAVEFVRPYYDERIVAVGWPAGSALVHFTLVDMDNPLRIRRLEMPAIEKGCDVFGQQVNLLNPAGHGPAFGLRVTCAHGTASGPLIGLNFKDGKSFSLQPEDFRSVIVSGYSGPQGIGGDFLGLSITKGSGHLTARIRLKSRIEMPWQLPERLYLKNIIATLCVANQEIVAIAVRRDLMDRQNPAPQKSLFYVLDRRDERWFSTEFPGDKTGIGIRGFGQWLGSYVAEPGRGDASPGLKGRRQNMTPTGTPFDWRVDKDRYYLPGLLFIYDVRRRKLYRWETGQGDSEVLLVSDGRVYYRVNRRIFSARIGESGLKDTRLLVEDDVVPDIHWAFLGPLYPKETREK